MHREQGYIFDYQSNEEWKEVQTLNRKKEESFSCELLEINSATQKSPKTPFSEIMSMNQLKDQIVFSHNDITSYRNYDDSIIMKENVKQQIKGNGALVDDISISRDQSKNGWLLSGSKNTSTGARQKSLGYPKQVQLVNTSDYVITSSKAQSAGLKPAQNINNLANASLNVVMNLKKRINFFITHHTLFGRNSVLNKNPKIRKMINDKSDGELQNTSMFIIERALYCLQQLGLNKFKKLKCLSSLEIPMIAPQNTWLFIWQVYINIYNQIFILILSFILIFSATKESPEIENYIFTVTFYKWILEIFLKLNTATFYKTTLFNTRSQVFKLYIKKKFFYDALPVVLLLFPSDNSIIQQTIFRAPIFFKIINMMSDKKEIEKQLMMILDNFFYIQLFNLTVNLFLVGHFISCLWYIVSIIDQTYLDKESSWIQTSLGSDGVWWKIYLSSFYWSFTLMATGSNTASTIIEMFFTSVVMLFTTIVFGYMVNMIGIILSEINKLEESKLRDINIINKYMKRKHISNFILKLHFEIFLRERIKIIGDQKIKKIIIKYQMICLQKKKKISQTNNNISYFFNLKFSINQFDNKLYLSKIFSLKKLKYTYYFLFLECQKDQSNVQIQILFRNKKRDLQTRVNLDLEYLYLRSMKQKSEDENSVLTKINPELCNSIKIEYNRDIVSKFKCLVDNFSEETIRQVCLELQEEFYSPNQIVFNQGETGDSSIMFLVTGQGKFIIKINQKQFEIKYNKVDLFSEVKFLKTGTDKKVTQGEAQMDYKIEKQSKFIFSLKKGTVFGELNFFTGLGRKLTAKSKQFSTILKLSRESFLNIIQKNPQDFEKFCEIKDKIILYSDYGPLKQGCSLCQSRFHFESACPSSHLKKDSPFIFAQYNFSRSQERNEYMLDDRKKTKFYHSYIHHSFFKEKAQLIQQNIEISQPENDEHESNNKINIEEDEEEEEEDQRFNHHGSSNDECENQQNTATQIKEDDEDEQQFTEQQRDQSVRLSLINPFQTIDDKTKKSEIQEKLNSSMQLIKHDIMNMTQRESIFKNNQEDTMSLNIPTSVNSAITPKIIARGASMYQTFAEKTELSQQLKELNMQDTIKEQEYQKDKLKKQKKSKVLEDVKRRISVNSKKKKNINMSQKKSQFDKEHTEEKEKTKANELIQKYASIHGENLATYNEKLLTSNLWNFDSIRVFLNYFPMGNYINQVNKYKQQRKKYEKKQLANNGDSTRRSKTFQFKKRLIEIK